MLKWINSRERWHDIGHVLFQFFLYTTLPWHGQGNVLFCLLIVLAIELYQAVGDPSTFLKFDTVKDIFTHGLGILLGYVIIELHFGNLVLPTLNLASI